MLVFPVPMSPTRTWKWKGKSCKFVSRKSRRWTYYSTSLGLSNDKQDICDGSAPVWHVWSYFQVLALWLIPTSQELFVSSINAEQRRWKVSRENIRRSAFAYMVWPVVTHKQTANDSTCVYSNWRKKIERINLDKVSAPAYYLTYTCALLHQFVLVFPGCLWPSVNIADQHQHQHQWLHYIHVNPCLIWV